MATPVTDPDDEDRDFSGNRPRRAGRTTFEYDTQGRVIRTTKRLLNGRRQVRVFTWNAYDQLVATVTPDGEQWRYLYDAAGRRISKQRLAAGTVAEEVHFTWDAINLAEQATHSGAVTTWEYAPGSHRAVVQLDQDTRQPEIDITFHAMVTDLVGKPTELLTLDGDIAWQQRTTLWGLPDTRPTASVYCPLRFPGQYADHETGWHYNHFRHYDPETGRYTAPDPLGLSPAPNPAAYVPNPTGLADPLRAGLQEGPDRMEQMGADRSHLGWPGRLQPPGRSWSPHESDGEDRGGASSVRAPTRTYPRGRSPAGTTRTNSTGRTC